MKCGWGTIRECWSLVPPGPPRIFSGFSFSEPSCTTLRSPSPMEWPWEVDLSVSPAELPDDSQCQPLVICMIHVRHLAKSSLQMTAVPAATIWDPQARTMRLTRQFIEPWDISQIVWCHRVSGWFFYTAKDKWKGTPHPDMIDFLKLRTHLTLVTFITLVIKLNI